jgi:hypothetical protein
LKKPGLTWFGRIPGHFALRHNDPSEVLKAFGLDQGCDEALALAEEDHLVEAGVQ